MKTYKEILEGYGCRWDVVRYGLIYEGKQPENLIDAFDISIEKWEVLRDLAEVGTRWISDSGPQTCGLCMLFHYKDCSGCPVDVATGGRGCSGTPYVKWNRGYFRNLDIAREEVEFLKKLREKWIKEVELGARLGISNA